MSTATLIPKLRARLGRIYGRRQRTLLDALLGAMATGLDDTIMQTGHAPAQIELDTAGGPWLDQHGTLYNIPRWVVNGVVESDQLYGPRIMAETIQPRPERDALVAIIKNAFGITVKIADLWPYVLISDQFNGPPAGSPPSVSDGQQMPGWGTDYNQAALSGLALPYLPGNFGVWVYVKITDPYSLTLAQLEALFPQFLLSDQSQAGSLHVSDGQLVIPVSNERIAFGSLGPSFSVTDADLLALLNRHRAAGTQAIIMMHIAAV